jgi:hypothetical protein
LRSIGIPTTADQVTDVAVVAVVVSLVAVLVGSLLGGTLGERWHTKLARRVIDPDVGPAAQARARADREEEERLDRIERDESLRRDLDHEDRVVELGDDDSTDEPRFTAAEWRAREDVSR